MKITVCFCVLARAKSINFVFFFFYERTCCSKERSSELCGLGLQMFLSFKGTPVMYKPDIRLYMFALAVMLLYMCMFADGVPLCLSLCVCVCVCTISSRCQHSSWPSSSSSCRSSRSSSSICSTFRGRGCSRSSRDRPACHCTPSLRVSTWYHITALHCNFVKSPTVLWSICGNQTLRENDLWRWSNTSFHLKYTWKC